MTPITLFYVIIGILSINFIVDKILDTLNARMFNAPIPNSLQDVYEKEEYQKSQHYKKTNAKFASMTGIFSFSVTLVFFFLDGFKFVDDMARSFSQNTIVISLLFFGIIMMGSSILNIPFSLYKTFVIEESFGFNKTSTKTFVLDKIKGMVLTIIIGGGLLALLVWFYEFTGSNFWVYAWIVMAIFSLLMNMFYAQLIVPLFNKQTPLEDGELKLAIENYARKVGFTLNNIFVIDGSKRSTKANAYFSGVGKQKRITLYDTLIKDLETTEIVAVLAHEVGHYKQKHIVYNLISSLLVTGCTLWLLSLFVGMPIFSEALGVAIPSFHVGLIAFGILYTPISVLTGLFMNFLSRRFEYQADNYAKETYNSPALIAALKKLSKNSLSNLTPHSAYVFMHFSHPTLLQRVQNLTK